MKAEHHYEEIYKTVFVTEHIVYLFTIFITLATILNFSQARMWQQVFDLPQSFT